MSPTNDPTTPRPTARILMVDDRPANLLALEAVLAPLGHELQRAHSGAEALQRLRHGEFAVILLDVHMPGMDGFETISLIKSRPAWQHVPIIFLTAVDTDHAQILRGYAHGAVDYLHKPFEPEVLISKVTVFVELWQRGAEIARLNRELQRLVDERTRDLAATNDELRRSLDRLRESQEQLLQSGKMAAVGTLVAGLSHELNNPLTIILNGAEAVLRRTPDDAPTRKTLVSIQDAAVRCGRLVHSLLGFARKSTAAREPIAPRALAERVVELAEGHARERGVRLRVDAPGAGAGAGDGQAWACRGEIESALLNLVLNAIDASRAGGVVVVRAGRAERRGARGAEFAVVDAGHGIPPDVLPRIFEPFYTTKPVGQGTGLGLSLARQIVDAHGGLLTVDSTPEIGTTMRVWLPARAAEVSGTRRATTPPPARRVTRAAGAGGEGRGGREGGEDGPDDASS